MENEIISESIAGKKRVLVISYDYIGQNMAGPGIRFYELSKILASVCDVTLAVPNKINLEIPGLKIISYDLDNYNSIKKYIEVSDTIFIQGHLLYYFPHIRNFKGSIVVDLYNPFNLESLEMYRQEDAAERVRIDKNNLNILNLQLSIGDFFICASEKQRDYWLGMLTSIGRINTYNYDADDSFRNIIDVVPFGIPANMPEHSRDTIRAVFPKINTEDKIVLWGGGIWNWLDPLTAIKAIWEITRYRKDVKLVFIGVKHPDPKLPEMQKAIEALNLSKELELLNEYVFFNEWTPYDLRQNFLLEADVGLSIHQKRIETEFSYRTRVMDYIWARLPIVTTEGDSIAKLVKEENIGEIVKYENTQNLARVLDSVLSNKSLQEIFKRNLNKIAPKYTWQNVAKPLVNYCIKSEPAPDKKNFLKIIELQNKKMVSLLKENIEGLANVLFITDNKQRDARYIEENSLGKVFFIQTGPEIENKKTDENFEKIISNIKTAIQRRASFDAIIVNNAFQGLTSKGFFDILNILNMRLKSDGLIFFSVPEKKGLSQLVNLSGKSFDNRETVDDFTMEYMFKNTGFEIIEKGSYEKFDEDSRLAEAYSEIGELYGKNELFELTEIKFSRKEFRNLKLLSRFDIFRSEELNKDKSFKGKLRKYFYSLTSLYFENVRKSFNETMKTFNNNIHLQINNEINELNRKNRERLLLIYFNIFKQLEFEIKNLGCDLNDLKRIIAGLKTNDEKKAGSEDKIELITRSFENIDKLLGLHFTSRYFLVKKI